jgi:hypothetical protein
MGPECRGWAGACEVIENLQVGQSWQQLSNPAVIGASKSRKVLYNPRALPIRFARTRHRPEKNTFGAVSCCFLRRP